MKAKDRHSWLYLAPIAAIFWLFAAFAVCPGVAQSNPVPTSVQSPSPAATPQVAIEPLPPDSVLFSFREKLQDSYFPKYIEKAYLKYKEGAYDQALSEIQKFENEETFSKRRPFPERALLIKALTLVAQGNFEAAQESLKHALTLKGSNAEVLFVLGAVYGAGADLKLAAQAFEETAWFGKGAVASPDLAHYALGLVYRQEKNSVKALASFNTALTLNPELIQARLDIAALSLETGDKAQAIIKLREVLAKNPASFQARVYLAKALLFNADRLLNRKEIAEAKQIMTEVLKPKELSKDQYLEALPVFVQAQLSSGDIKAAETVVANALKRDPHSSVILQLKDQVDLERQALG